MSRMKTILGEEFISCEIPLRMRPSRFHPAEKYRKTEASLSGNGNRLSNRRDRVSSKAPEKGGLHRNMTKAQTLGDHISLSGNGFLALEARARCVQH